MMYGVMIIIGMCILVLMVGILKKNASVLFSFLTRAVLGMICVYFCNEFFKMQGIGVSVGMNPISFVTIGVLGLSGFVLLYGILFFRIL